MSGVVDSPTLLRLLSPHVDWRQETEGIYETEDDLKSNRWFASKLFPSTSRLHVQRVHMGRLRADVDALNYVCKPAP